MVITGEIPAAAQVPDVGSVTPSPIGSRRSSDYCNNEDQVPDLGSDGPSPIGSMQIEKSNRSQFIQQDLFGSDLPATGLRNKELSINKKEERDAALLVPTGTEWDD
ncbi:hypothetical protein KY290_020118 [Solanum tuberosum]|uniref:Uncharacterized protein n=1 Tax=Solanum tuberosum TaxID=4113 RepID=A0ABQ7VJ00_SOLTU|nr:hypothetical protein KY284_018504 [Solanum tuberosum]KAH0764045.1 hypothetical protein KY290_020118 [Solanum tuberosum]